MKNINKHIISHYYTLNINRVLQSRSFEGKLGYIIFVNISCLFCAIFTFFFIFNNNGESEINKVSLIIFLIIIFDLISLLLNLTRRSIIEPINLAIFPLSFKQVNKTFVFSLIFDYKSSVYILTSSIFFIFFIIKYSIISAVLNVICWLLILVTMQIWYITVYLCIENFIHSHRNKIITLFFMFLILISIVINLNYNVISYIPVVSHGAKIIVSLTGFDINIIALNIIYMIVFICIGVVLSGIISKIKIKYIYFD